MNSSCDLDLPPPDYFSHRYRLIGTLFQGAIFVIGVLGNAFVVAVVLRVRSLRSPTNCYLLSLAVADTIVLLASVPNEIFSYYMVGNRWLWGEVGCRIIIFFQNLGINSSSLSLIAFTVERYIAICHPMKAHKMCTIGRAKRITYGVWVFACVYCSPWLLGLTTTKPLKYRGQPEVLQCAFRWPRNEYLAVFFTDLVMFYVIPLTISCILYYYIGRSLHSELQIPDAVTATVKQQRLGHKSQVVKMLAVVVVVFALLWLPFRGMLVYNSFASLLGRPLFLDLWFLMFAKTCVYINSAINPFLYNIMSSNFRQAFHRTLFRKKQGGFRRNRPSLAPSTLSTFHHQPSTSQETSGSIRLHSRRTNE